MCNRAIWEAALGDEKPWQRLIDNTTSPFAIATEKWDCCKFLLWLPVSQAQSFCSFFNFWISKISIA